ncbi:lipoxygenase [Mycena floridula]|nr:lipoxygenase [Mycena floridula]
MKFHLTAAFVLSGIAFVHALDEIISNVAMTDVSKFTLPFGEFNTTARAAAIAATRVGFYYGPDIAGVPGAYGSFFPTGPLGIEMAEEMKADLDSTHVPWVENVVTPEAVHATLSACLDGGLKTFEDYKKLYNNTWLNTIPDGVAAGVLSNGTSDLLFAMDRLSIQPYSVRRVNASEPLSFTVDNVTAKHLTTQTQAELRASGRLFYIDYRSLADQTLTEGRYAGACDAYFFIHPVSGDFLPLAIRPNYGSPLVYTPLDSPNDWHIAKLLFNQNDLWWGQWYHLVATHEVVELIYQMAVRTLSAEHPVFALMTRLAYQAFSMRKIAIDVLINKDGFIDKVFSWGGAAAGNFSSLLYHQSAGKWQSNYISNHLAARGLIGSKLVPALKSFPFYSDANNITTAIRQFMNTTVASYYINETMIRKDKELQNFVLEAKPAEAIDFPSSVINTSQLVDILTHFAYLVAVLHGTLNTNELVHTSLVLPYHPTALYAPLPTHKNISDSELMSFMPPLEEAVQQIILAGAFTRPQFARTDKALTEMFADTEMLSRMNYQTNVAARTFKDKMKEFSKVVSRRTFDAQGLSQGMPFIWKVLDPEVTPFYLTI